jgi:hypothetical protein
MSQPFQDDARQNTVRVMRNTNSLVKFGSTPFISWVIPMNERSGYYFLCPLLQMLQGSLKNKYPKIKYAIFDRPHNLGIDLCEE